MYFIGNLRNKQLRAHLVSETSDGSSDFEITTDAELSRLKQDILVSNTVRSMQYNIFTVWYCMTTFTH